MLGLLDNPAIVQKFGRHFFVGCEAAVERRQTDLEPALLEDVCETTLRQTTMQWHLAAFETYFRGITRARLLTLLASSGRLAQTRARSPANALLLMYRTLRGLQIV